MSRLQFLAAALVIPLVFLGCSDDPETIIVRDDPPTIESVTPGNIPSSESVLVTILGTYFQAGAIVLLDGVPATAVTVVSDTLITAFVVPPTGAGGSYPLVVRNPDGQEASTTVDYDGGPVVTSVSPYGGDLAGGTAVTITGQNFQAGAIVLIDGLPATGVTVVLATSITCTTPATASATQLLAEIIVQNPDNQKGNLLDVSAAVAEDRGFLYSPVPTVTGINPLNGAQAGGTSVTITGTGFHRTIALGGEADTDATVDFDGTAATNVTVVDANTITCDTPAHAAGDVDVVVTNPDTQIGTGVNLFHYNEFPVITSVTPNMVGIAGGTTVTIAGPAGATYYLNGATVTINGNPCTNYVYAGVPDSLDCDVPANPIGTYDVILTNPDGQSVTWGPTTTDPGMTYQPGPAVTAVVPNNGDIVGGYIVQVQGTGFDISAGGVSVDFGTETTGALTATNATTIDVPAVNMPASNGQIGWVNVRVTNIPTTLTGQLNNGFMYTDTGNPPDITGIAPNSGPMAGGTTITVTGIQFWNGTVIEINSQGGWQACTNYNYAGVPTTIVCDTPAGSGPGPWDVRATNPDLTLEQTPPPFETFLYIAPAAPTVTGVVPATGLINTGTAVTVSGTGFYGIVNGASAEPTVDFIGTNNGTLAATGVTVTNGTTLTCTTPLATFPEPVTVRVILADGQFGEMANAFTFTAPPPTVIDVNGNNPYGGYWGETVTITGTGFFAGATVTIGGVGGTPATNVTVVNATTITCDLPRADSFAGLYGHQVVVTNPDTNFSTDSVTVDYRPLPTAIVPNSGPSGTANPITVQSTDGSFENGLTATIGAVACTSITFVDRYSFTCNTPSSLSGPQNLIVTNATAPNYTDPTPHLQFNFGNIQFWELTSWSDFGQQAISNTDYWTTLGDVQLSAGPGGFFSCGDLVTCVAFWEGGCTPTNQRFLVGTANSGAFLTNDGGTNWTAFNRLADRSFPSNRINCVAFYSGPRYTTGTATFTSGSPTVTGTGTSWTTSGIAAGWQIQLNSAANAYTIQSVDNDTQITLTTNVAAADAGNGAYTAAPVTGNSFMIGTAAGVAITYNGGANFTILNNGTTPALPQNYVWDVDYCDDAVTPSFMLVATASPNLGSNTGGCLYMTGATTRVFNQNNLEGGWGGDDTNRTMSADFHDVDNTGQTFLIACSDVPGGWGTRGASYKTVNGGTAFAKHQPWGGGNKEFHRVARFCNAVASGNTFLIGSSDNTQGAQYTVNDGGAWTQVPGLPVNVAIDAAYFDGSNFLIATPGGARITNDGGSNWDDINTASTGGFGNIVSNLTRGVAWHTSMGNANSLMIGCGDVTADVVTGGLEVSVNGGTAFTLFESDPTASNRFADPPADLPSADITSIAFDPGDSSGNTLLVGTRDGAALSIDGGTSWTWFQGGNIPSDIINDVAILTTGGNTYILLGTDLGLAYSNNGGSSFSDETSNLAAGSVDVTGVAFYDGTHYAAVTGGGGGDINFHDGGNGWSSFNNSTAGIPAGNDFVGVDLFRGTGSSQMDYVVFGTNGNGVVRGEFTNSNNYITFSGAAALPNDTVTSVAFDQGSSTTNLRVVIGTTGGGAQAFAFETGTPSWQQMDTGNGLPHNQVNDCAYFGGVANGNNFMFATQNGAVYTTDGWNTAITVINRGSSGIWLPTNDSSACAYFDGNTTGDRMLIGCPTIGADSEGGVVLRAGTTFMSSGSLVIGQVDGLLLPATASTPSLPDRNIRGVCYFNGDANSTTFIAATDYGVALTNDGGQTFTPIRENLPAANSLLSNRITDVAVHKLSSASNNLTMLVGTENTGAAITGDSGATWTLINTNTVPWTTPTLPSDNVRWVAFHDGVGSATSFPNNLTYLICTDRGTVYIKNGTFVVTFDNGHADAPNNFQNSADFDDSVTTGQFSFLVCATAGGGGGGGGVFLTTDDGTSFSRWSHNNPVPNQSSYKATTAFFNTTTFFMGADPSLAGAGFAGSICRTTDTGTSFDQWLQADGLAGSNIRYFALCDVNANPSHWMAVTTGQAVNVTTNGDLAQANVTFTQYDNTNGLASNNALSCAYWNGTGATGNVWAVGTDAGLSQTSNGGGDLKLVRRSQYTTGTATFTVGSPTVTGAGTSWSTSGIAPGWTILLDSVGTPYTVQSVDNDTQITLTANVAGGDGGNGAYTAFQQTPTGYLSLRVTETIPGSTNITYDILDGVGTPIGGYTNLTPTGGTIDISGISYTTYPVIQVRVNMTTTNTSVTPVLHDIQIYFTY